MTPHFTVSEFERTQTGLRNIMPPHGECAARALCSAVLEPWRERVGPLQVTSGWRSRAVNTAVGGSATSQHMRGEAADLVPMTTDRLQAWGILLEMMAAGLPVDQACIYEATRHVHVSHTSRHMARREAWVQTREGVWVIWGYYGGDLK